MKLQQEETSDNWGVRVTPASSERKSDTNGMPALGTRIVSHVPGSASVSSLSSDSSSSLSSAQYHPSQSVFPKDDDQAGKSPVLKAIVSVGAGKGLLTRSESKTESCVTTPRSTTEANNVEINKAGTSTQQHGFTRTISFLSGDVPDGANRSAKKARTHGPNRLLLATTKDSAVLSPLHIFVRQQIEVFEASEEDLKQPAPGRRIPIQLHQVGLRCIWCKHQKARERKKRAVCYPSSVGRVYHSVSDMKFAHFPCHQMPEDIRDRFLELKDDSQLQSKLYKDSGSKRVGSANASTSQHYHDTACELGLIDGKGGIFASRSGLSVGSSTWVESSNLPLLCTKNEPSLMLAAISQATALQGMLMGNLSPTVASTSVAAAVAARNQGNAALALQKAHPLAMIASGSPSDNTTVIPLPLVHENAKLTSARKPQASPKSDGIRFLLTNEMDKHYLTPIHCFVRKHVEVFAADEQDLAAPAPGRKKPIVLGQVGLRCVWCARLPVKQRVKRAICFPPATSGIYHALSNMKFDHFKHCKGIPKEAKEEFHELSSSSPPSSSSSSGGRRNSSRPRVSNSTAQYYHDSALRMGLYDTPNGIRYRQRSTPSVLASSETVDEVQQPIPGVVANPGKGDRVQGMEALIIAATDPGIRAAHEERKASPAAGRSELSAAC